MDRCDCARVVLTGRGRCAATSSVGMMVLMLVHALVRCCGVSFATIFSCFLSSKNKCVLLGSGSGTSNRPAEMNKSMNNTDSPF